MNKDKKIVKSFTVSERLWDHFQITTSAMKESQSQALENLIRDYIIKNKVDVNEIIKEFWEK